ncbi:SIS domain-containing protein, partial [Pseudomonas gingeri]|uniref:SIS domain-containing protein n=1 Tax=Pseudomonas gingeri TaxID=117681 RepID=UPI0015A16773
VSLQQPPLHLKKCWVAAFSQSGKSPDLIDSLRYLQQRGAASAALVNTTDSPLAAISGHEILLPAGLEQSVAATKSYVAMLMASAQIVARQAADNTLGQALLSLPQQMNEAASEDWSQVLE